jgi:hypothetical protein
VVAVVEAVMARVLAAQAVVALVVLGLPRKMEHPEPQIQAVVAVVLIAALQAPVVAPVLVVLELLFLDTLTQ